MLSTVRFLPSLFYWNCSFRDCWCLELSTPWASSQPSVYLISQCILHSLFVLWASFMAQLIKNLPVMWETWIWSLGWEDPLEKGTATHSSSLGIANFLEEISSLCRSIVSLYFFSWITEEGFLISPCYSLELCIRMRVSFLFSFPFPFSFFSFLSYL